MTAEQEQLLTEWAKYTTGANVHNMNVIRHRYMVFSGHANPEVYADCVDRGDEERTATKMRGIIAELKLAELKGTHYHVVA